MFGTPVSIGAWQAINAVAAALLVIAAALPVVTAGLWHRHPWRPVLLTVASIVAVGCTMHALIGITTRVLSLAGVLTLEYPFFATIDRRAADLQALLLNEPWFLVEGLVWGALAWYALQSARARRMWLLGTTAAVAALTVVGMLSSAGVIGRFIIG